jgi:hypothetical protein
VDADHANIPMIVAACVALAIGGAADNVSAIYRSTMMQAAVPDAVRGRLQGIFIVVVAGGPRIGALYAGTLATITTLWFPPLVGGILIIAIVAVLARLHPRFRATPRTLSLASRGPRRTPARLRRVSDVALGGCRRRRTPPLESARDTFPRLPASSGAGRSRAFCSGDRRAVRSRGDHLGIELPLHEGRPRRHLPAQVAWGRLVLGAATLGVFVLVRRDRLPARAVRAGVGAHDGARGDVLRRAVLLFSWAEQHVSSGLGSIYNATTPIMTAIMAALVFRVERLKPVQIAGIVVGIGGVVVIIAPWTGLDLTQSVLAQLALLGATACYGFSLAYMRRFLANSGMSPLAFSFVNIGIAAAIMTVLAPTMALTPVRLDPWIVGSMVLLGASAPESPTSGTRTPSGMGPHGGVDRDLHHARRGRGTGRGRARRTRRLARAARRRHRLPRHPAGAEPSPDAETAAAPCERDDRRQAEGSGLERALQVERDGDVLADEHAAGLERRVPRETEVLAVDDGVAVAPAL